MSAGLSVPCYRRLTLQSRCEIKLLGDTISRSPRVSKALLARSEPGPGSLHCSALTLTPPLRSCLPNSSQIETYTKAQDFLTTQPATNPPMLCPSQLPEQGGLQPFHSNAPRESCRPKLCMAQTSHGPSTLSSPTKSPNCSSPRLNHSSVGLHFSCIQECWI